ncbi:MAG: MATE family efflux transporter, partial [Pseudomonadota bacterium]|nr:MATE family efflux transporter [Pseudomonadota bacterium]
FRLSARAARTTVSIALPRIINAIVWPMVWLSLTTTLLRFGEAELIGWGVLQRLSFTFGAVTSALAGALAYLVASSIGAGNRIQASRFTVAGVGVGIVCAVLFAAICVAMSPHLVDVFAAVPVGSGANGADQVVAVLALAVPFAVMFELLEVCLQSSFRSRAFVALTVMRPLAVLLAFHLFGAMFELKGVLYGSLVGEAAMAMVVLWAAIRFGLVWRQQPPDERTIPS